MIPLLYKDNYRDDQYHKFVKNAKQVYVEAKL